jgi:hypothetical protein
MKSLQKLLNQNAGLPIVADDVLEFHAARLVLLIRYCGVRNRVTKEYRIQGLTKMAKLDFFIRYPAFFNEVTTINQEEARAACPPESPMIRYHYGPWDQRYYRVLAYLIAKGLISLSKDGTTVILSLTADGKKAAERLTDEKCYADLLKHVSEVSGAFRNKSGNALKKLIYKAFDEEVGELPWGEVIRP